MLPTGLSESNESSGSWGWPIVGIDPIPVDGLETMLFFGEYSSFKLGLF